MRTALCMGVFLLFVTLCPAQTARSHGSTGEMNPCVDPPLKHRSSDPSDMVSIKSCDFYMGDSSGIGEHDEIPVHEVHLPAYYMDRFELTNKKYCKYLNSAHSQGLIQVVGGVVYDAGAGSSYAFCATTSALPWYPYFGNFSRITWDGMIFSVTPGKENHPLTVVSWFGAAAYANWRSAMDGLTPCYDPLDWNCSFGADGYRLPTEAEWENAARGGLQHPPHDYPWGSTIDGARANYSASGDPYETGDQPCTTPVGYYDGNQIPSGANMANGYGLYDMSGNVKEWCNDWYWDDYYLFCINFGIYYHPFGPETGSSRVVRGGAWDDMESDLRCAYRNHRLPTMMINTVGFRLVRKIP